MNIRPATVSDYTELVGMFSSLIDAVYDGVEKGEEIFFHGAVQNWFNSRKDVIVCEKDDGTITGFSLAYVEELGFLKPYYYGDIAYVKPEFRKGRTAYLLYNNVVDYATQQGLPVIAKAFVSEENENKVDKIQAKFGKPRFIEYFRGV